MGKVPSEGTGMLFIGVKSLETPNEKDPNNTGSRNDTSHKQQLQGRRQS